MGVRAGSSDLRKLTRKLQSGFYLVSDGKSKTVIMRPNGEPLRYEDGRPVGLPNSPCRRTFDDVQKRLKAVGALKV